MKQTTRLNSHRLSNSTLRGKRGCVSPPVALFRRSPVALHRPAHAGRSPVVLPKRRGLTLFEVLISLAIFVSAAAIIAQLVSSGARGAIHARLQTQAVLRCESVMAEVVSGVLPLQAVAGTPFSDDSSWSWSLNLAEGPMESLYLVEVTVAHSGGGQAGNVSFSLQRYLRDPQLYIDAMIAAEEAAAAAEQSSSSTGSTGQSSTGGSR